MVLLGHDLLTGYLFGTVLAKLTPFTPAELATIRRLAGERTDGVAFAPDPAHAASIVMALAAGEVSEESFTLWIRDRWPRDQ